MCRAHWEVPLLFRVKPWVTEIGNGLSTVVT